MALLSLSKLLSSKGRQAGKQIIINENLNEGERVSERGYDGMLVCFVVQFRR